MGKRLVVSKAQRGAGQGLWAALAPEQAKHKAGRAELLQLPKTHTQISCPNPAPTCTPRAQTLKGSSGPSCIPQVHTSATPSLLWGSSPHTSPPSPQLSSLIQPPLHSSAAPEALGEPGPGRGGAGQTLQGSECCSELPRGALSAPPPSGKEGKASLPHTAGCPSPEHSGVRNAAPTPARSHVAPQLCWVWVPCRAMGRRHCQAAAEPQM